MGQGQKGSSDKTEGKEKRHDFPPPEDGHKCRVCRFPLLVALLQLLLGVAVTAVAFLMLAISPSLSARETPHWAGIILCLVSILGFILYCVTYLPDERTSMQFIAKLHAFVHPASVDSSRLPSLELKLDWNRPKYSPITMPAASQKAPSSGRWRHFF
ncbi:sarcospan [Amphiprion ocellaris]|uniref:sarcospan n=1 Tax=Amphiprion ocellaris TaxID=80972 RepID=UPI00241174F0|nr:sarcospan [Amphiprion ocellaris]